MDIHKKKKISLVLSGGGIKAAAFHIGACLALREKGFAFSGGSKDHVTTQATTPAKSNKLAINLYVGSSAGAFVSAVLASGHSLEALINAFQVGVGSDPYYKVKAEDKLYPIGYQRTQRSPFV